MQPIFGLIMKEILEQKLEEIHDTIVPEFPLRQSGKNNYSNNVDYVARSDKAVYLIELKTDIGSVREEQLEYLKKAKTIKFKCCVENLKKIATASPYRPKYVHLLYLLAKLQLICKDSLKGLHELAQTKPATGWKKKISGVVVTDFSLEPKVVYIVPEKKRFCEHIKAHFPGFASVIDEVIDFNDIAEIFQKRGPSSFACYLERWAKHEAGTPHPSGPQK